MSENKSYTVTYVGNKRIGDQELIAPTTLDEAAYHAAGLNQEYGDIDYVVTLSSRRKSK